MYAIRDKKSKQILAVHPAPLSQALTGKDVHPGFDSSTMQLLKYDGDRLPIHYKVSRAGIVSEMTLEERAAGNLISFSREFIQKVEYDSETGDSAVLNGTKFALQLELIKSETDCLLALDLLASDLAAQIAQKYNAGYEAKIMKGCIDWLMEDRPPNDPREAAYLTMKAEIAAIKESYAGTKSAIKSIQANI